MTNHAKKEAPSTKPEAANNTNIISQETESVKPCSFWIDLDDLHFRMECAVKMVNAVHEAMVNGDCAAECYNDALWGAGEYMRVLTKELGHVVTEMRDAV